MRKFGRKQKAKIDPFPETGLPQNLGIYIFHEDDLIKIRFSSITISEKDAHLPVNLKPPEPNFTSDIESVKRISLLGSMLSLSSQIDSEKAFQPVIEAPVIFYAYGKENQQNQLKYSSITYTLSTIPHVAINWIACLANNIIYAYNPYSAYIEPENFLKRLIYNDDQKYIFPKKISTYFTQTPINRTIIPIFLMHLCSQEIKKTPYQHTINDICRLYNFYKDIQAAPNSLSLIKCLAPPRRFLIFWKDLYDFYKKINASPNSLSRISCLTPRNRFLVFGNDLPETNFEEKKRFLVNYIKNFTGPRQEMIFILENMDFLTKGYLFMPSMNPDLGGWKYHDASPECIFFLHAKFVLHDNDRLAIIDLQNNLGYKKYYSFTHAFYHDFEEKIRHFGACIGLEFSPETDFHQKIIFTKECSNFLKAQGLDFSWVYNSKKLLYINSQLNFFAKSTYVLPKTDEEKTTGYSISLISEKARHPGVIYLKEMAEGLCYEVINLKGKVLTSIIDWNSLPETFPRALSDIIKSEAETLPAILQEIIKVGHAQVTTFCSLPVEVKEHIFESVFRPY